MKRTKFEVTEVQTMKSTKQNFHSKMFNKK